MKRVNAFGRSLAFAAIAALAWPAFAIALNPLAGGRLALSLYLVATSAAYVASLATRRLDAAIAAFTTAAIGAAFAAVAGDAGAVALGAAFAIGVGRSGVLYRSRGARALAIEATLLGGGLLVAKLVASPSVLGVALGLWSFYLVQSAYAAIGGVHAVGARAATQAGVDRFDAARRRALALLEEDA